jgi:hypothetical protein
MKEGYDKEVSRNLGATSGVFSGGKTKHVLKLRIFWDVLPCS